MKESNKTIRKAKINELEDLVKKFKHIETKFDYLKRDVGLFEKATYEKVIQESMFEF